MPEDEVPRESIALTAAISRGEPPYLQIARHYREQIEQGKLQSGASLPSVREMAEIWGVAHTTAARTLKALQDQGLVVSTPGFGTVVVAGEQGAERLAHRFHDLFRAALVNAGITGIALRNQQRKVVAVALVDVGDAGDLNGPWYLNAGGYAANQYGYMHRRICGLDSGDPREVDHRNGDRLDNRRSNLHVVAHQRNSQNVVRRQGGASAYRGVAWSDPAKKWRAYGNQDDKQIHLGLFVDEIEAAAAAQAWRVENMPGTNEGRAVTWPQDYLRFAAAVPWADVPEQNKQLMIAVAQRLLSEWPR